MNPKKNWKTTLLGVIAGGAIAISTGNCTSIVGMIPAEQQQIVGAVAGAAVVVLGAVARDDNKEQ